LGNGWLFDIETLTASVNPVGAVDVPTIADGNGMTKGMMPRLTNSLGNSTVTSPFPCAVGGRTVLTVTPGVTLLAMIACAGIADTWEEVATSVDADAVVAATVADVAAGVDVAAVAGVEVAAAAGAAAAADVVGVGVGVAEATGEGELATGATTAGKTGGGAVGMATISSGEINFTMFMVVPPLNGLAAGLTACKMT
jgi:hypothetical protein